MVIKWKLELDNMLIYLIFHLKILKVNFRLSKLTLAYCSSEAKIAQWRFQIDLPSDPFGWRIDDC